MKLSKAAKHRSKRSKKKQASAPWSKLDEFRQARKVERKARKAKLKAMSPDEKKAFLVKESREKAQVKKENKAIVRSIINRMDKQGAVVASSPKPEDRDE